MPVTGDQLTKLTNFVSKITSTLNLSKSASINYTRSNARDAFDLSAYIYSRRQYVRDVLRMLKE